jgi:hypothetical protein
MVKKEIENSYVTVIIVSYNRKMNERKLHY